MENLNAKKFLSRRMLERSLKIMNGEKGGGFYVKYKFLANSGIGYIELLLEYPDGVVVAIPLCKNVCREVNEEGNVIGKWEKPYHQELTFYGIQKYEEKKHHAPGNGGGTKNDYDSFIKYERPDFKIPIQIIWDRICKLWEILPIVTQHEAFVLEDIYLRLLDYGIAKAEENDIFKDEESVFLTSSEIKELLSDTEFEFSDIRRLFDNRNLWIKDKGTAGFQFSKKIDGKKQHFYRLRKINTNEEISINTEYCTDFQEIK